MIRDVFVIRDAKAEVFNMPFFKLTKGEAERDFRSLVNEPGSNVNKYPDDFDLYYIGTYDDISGTVKSLDTPQHLCKAVSVLKV